MTRLTRMLSLIRAQAFLSMWFALSIIQVSPAQILSFIPVDTIHHSNLKYRVSIDEEGYRYYDVRSGTAPFSINGVDQSSPLGTYEPYMVILDSSGQHVYTLDRCANGAYHLTDDKLICFTGFGADSIVVDGLTYINAGGGHGGDNLLIRQLTKGYPEPLEAEHWQTRDSVRYEVTHADVVGDYLSIMGEYESFASDTYVVHIDSFALIHWNERETFVGQLGPDLRPTWLTAIFGAAEDRPIDLHTLEDGSTVMMGVSVSGFVLLGDLSEPDTFVNPSWDITGSFTYMLVFDTLGRLTTSKVFDHGLGSVIVQEALRYSDGRWFVHVRCSRCDRIKLDSVEVIPTEGYQESVFFVLDTSWIADTAVQFSAGFGDHRVIQMDIDEHDRIWFVGQSDADSIRLGDELLTSSDGEIIQFVGAIDHNLNVVLFDQLDFIPRRLFVAENGNTVYIIRRLEHNIDVLLRIDERPSSVPSQVSESPQIAVCPSIIAPGDQIRLCMPFSSPKQYRVARLAIYDSAGRRMISAQTDHYADDVSVETRGWTPGLYLVQVTLEDGQTEHHRLIVQ